MLCGAWLACLKGVAGAAAAAARAQPNGQAQRAVQPGTTWAEQRSGAPARARVPRPTAAMRTRTPTWVQGPGVPFEGGLRIFDESWVGGERGAGREGGCLHALRSAAWRHPQAAGGGAACRQRPCRACPTHPAQPCVASPPFTGRHGRECHAGLHRRAVRGPRVDAVQRGAGVRQRRACTGLCASAFPHGRCRQRQPGLRLLHRGSSAAACLSTLSRQEAAALTVPQGLVAYARADVGPPNMQEFLQARATRRGGSTAQAWPALCAWRHATAWWRHLHAADQAGRASLLPPAGDGVTQAQARAAQPLPPPRGPPNSPHVCRAPRTRRSATSRWSCRPASPPARCCCGAAHSTTPPPSSWPSPPTAPAAGRRCRWAVWGGGVKQGPVGAPGGPDAAGSLV